MTGTKCVLCGIVTDWQSEWFDFKKHRYHASCAGKRIEQLEAEIEDLEASHENDLREVEHEAKEAGFAAGQKGGWY